MLEQFLEFDTQLFLFLNNLGSERWDGLWWFITQNWAPIPLYILLLYLIYKHYGIRGTVVSAIFVALMIAFTDQIAGFFKHGICRPRPCQEEDLLAQMRDVIVICGRYGFFSAHAASSMAAAVFLGMCLRKWYPYLVFILLLWAAITGYSRIYLGVHYPLDVVVGMFFGGIVGWGFYLWQCWGQKRFNSRHNESLQA